MGDENTVLDAATARHLLRRTGFGAAPKDVQSILDRGLTRGQAADELLVFSSKAFKPSGRYIEDAHNKWVKFIIKTKFSLHEKLVLFFHDHFATSNVKVQNVKTMGNQIRLIHTMCHGSFKDFVKAMNRDAAMLEFLDTVRNQKDSPNENYGRELQELFTLGVKDFAGNPNYVQADIVQIARAFTGWNYEYNSGKSFYEDNNHDHMTDYPGRGPKTIYQSTGGFGSNGMSYVDGSVLVPPSIHGEGAQEIDNVIEVIFAHKDTNSKNTVARRTARRLLEYFAHPIADPISPANIAVVDQVVTESGFDSNWNIPALVRAILVNDSFYLTSAQAPFNAGTVKSVKWPVDYVVSTLRLLGMNLKGKFQFVDGGDFAGIRDQLTNMGQTLLEPPSVFGWDWEASWLSSATLLARYNFVTDLVSARGNGKGSLRTSKFFDLSLSVPDDILLAVTDLLGVTDQITAVERNIFVDYLTDGSTVTSLNLNDYDTRNRKLNGLFALVLQSPAYQLH